MATDLTVRNQFFYQLLRVQTFLLSIHDVHPHSSASTFAFSRYFTTLNPTMINRPIFHNPHDLLGSIYMHSSLACPHSPTALYPKIMYRTNVSNPLRF
jgi:hypothetical protein